MKNLPKVSADPDFRKKDSVTKKPVVAAISTAINSTVNSTVVNSNNNVNINIYVNNHAELTTALEELSTQNLITKEQLEKVKPVQQLLQDKGYTSFDQVLGLMESLDTSVDDVLDSFTSDESGVAKEITAILRRGCALKFAYDKEQGTFIRMQPPEIIAYLAQQLWLKLFLPDFDEHVDNKDRTLECLISRSVRKDAGSHNYCDVKRVAKVTADGKLLDQNDKDWKKYYSDYNLDSDDAIGSEDDENDILFRRAQARNKFECIDVYKYTKWTRAKWDTIVTNGLSSISEAICRAVQRELLVPVLQKSLADYVSEHMTETAPDAVPWLTITDKIKRDLEKKVIADGKESLVAGWRVIADFLEKTSAQHRRVKEKKIANAKPFEIYGKKSRNQVALQTDAPLLRIN